MSLESNEKLVDELLIGAEQAAAGRTLGLTDDQTIDLVQGRNERLRQAQRAQYVERELREGNRAAAEEFLAQNDREVEFARNYDDRSLVQEDLVDDGGQEKPLRHQKLRENARRKRKAGKFSQAAWVMDKADEAAEKQKLFDFGLVGMGQNAVLDAEGNAAPFGNAKAGQRQVVDRLQSMIANGEVGLDDVVGGKRVEDILYNLARHVSPQLEVQKEKRRVREMIQQDAPNERAALENKIKANIEALNIKEGDLGVRNRIGRNNLAQMGEIINIGGAGGAGAFSPAQVGLKDDSPAYYDAVRMVGPDGETVGYANPGGDRFLGDVNLPGTANQVNAPVTPKGVSWVADNYLQYKPDQAMPKVGIMEELRRFTDRLNGLGYGETAAREMRGLDEFEKAVDFVVAKAGQKGDTLYAFDTEAGRNVPAAHPGVDEVLQKMRYTPNEKAALAYALYQLELGKGNAGNEAFKEKFAKRLPNSFNKDVRFDDQYETPLAKIKNEKVGRGKKRQGVKAELRKLSDPDAAMPFYGAVEGEGAPRARFIPGNAYGMPNSEIMERYPKYGEDMIGVRDRFQRDVLLQAGPGRPDTFAAGQRALDAEIEARIPKIQRQKEVAELQEMARLLGENRTVHYREGVAPARNVKAFAFEQEGPVDFDKPVGAKPGDIGQGGEKVRVTKFRVPNESEFNQNPAFRRAAPKQPIQQASVPSIAPTPGDITGSQPAPAADAGRGGWMGGDNSGRITSPWNSRSNAPAGAGKPMPESMRQELFALPNRSGDAGRRIMGDRTEGYMTSMDQPTDARKRREIIRGIERQNLRRRVGGGAAALGGAAGLAALIGGERDRREEEQVR